jgi:hypothetical protein
MIYEQQETGTTPHIRFDTEENTFLIEGRSLAENAMEFYGALIDWLDETFRIEKRMLLWLSSWIIAIRVLIWAWLNCYVS